MTRFEQELSGMLGEYWQKNAEHELDRIRSDLAEGLITVDTDGVARNCIGRAMASDMVEKLSHVTDAFDADATLKAREKEVEASIAEYRKNARTPSAKDFAEMLAAFGTGTTVVDVLTGQTYKL